MAQRRPRKPSSKARVERIRGTDFEAYYRAYEQTTNNKKISFEKFRRATILLGASDYSQKRIREMLSINSRTLKKVNSITNARTQEEDNYIRIRSRKNMRIPHKLSKANFAERTRRISALLRPLGVTANSIKYLVHTRRYTPEFVLERLKKLELVGAPVKGLTFTLSLSEPEFEKKLGQFRQRTYKNTVRIVGPKPPKPKSRPKTKPLLINSRIAKERSKKPLLFEASAYDPLSYPAQMERLYRAGASFERTVEAGERLGKARPVTVLRFAKQIQEHYNRNPRSPMQTKPKPVMKF